MKISKKHPLLYIRYKDKIVKNDRNQEGVVVGYCEFNGQNIVLIAQGYTKQHYSSLRVFIKYHGNNIKDFHGDASMSFFLFDEYSINRGYIKSIEEKQYENKQNTSRSI